MKKLIDITKWLRTGASPFAINIGDRFEPVNYPEMELVGDDPNFGYYHSKYDWRIMNDDGRVVEVGANVMFSSGLATYILLYKNKRYKLNKLKIHNMLGLLNESQIAWHAVEDTDVDRLTVYLPVSKIHICFQVYDGATEFIGQSTLS